MQGMMFCERYRCEMLPRACVLRQRKYDRPVGFSAGNRDPGCKDCAQGKQIRQKMKGKLMDTAVTAPALKERAGINVAEELDALEIAANKADKVGLPKEKEEKRCARCKSDLPADLKHFYKDKKSATGLSSWCIMCTRDAVRKSAAKKAAKEAAARPGYSAADNNPAPAVHPARAVAKGEIDPALEKELEGVIVLDFSAREELLKRIEEAADRQYRIPEQQIMYWAEQGLRMFEQLVDNDQRAPFGARKETT